MKNRVISSIVFLLICCSFPFRVDASKENAQINELVKKEHFFLIDGYIYIDELGNKDFAIEDGSNYTIYNDEISYYEPGVEWDIDFVSFDKNAYLAGIENLDITVSDIENQKYSISDKTELKTFFKHQNKSYLDRLDIFGRVEIKFDNENRPIGFNYYDKEGEKIKNYSIGYLSPAEFYFRYYRRRLAEPFYRIYYTVRYYFQENPVYGVLAGVILAIVSVLFVYVTYKLLFWLFSKKFTTNRLKKLILFLFSGLFVIASLGIYPVSLLFFLLAVFIWLIGIGCKQIWIWLKKAK